MQWSVESSMYLLSVVRRLGGGENERVAGRLRGIGKPFSTLQPPALFTYGPAIHLFRCVSTHLAFNISKSATQAKWAS